MFEGIFREAKFEPVKFFRRGPRVYVVGGRWGKRGGEEAVFKSPFRPNQTLTSQHLRREAVFLKSAPAYLQRFLPEIYDFGQEKDGRFWYLVEWLRPGQPQTVGESDFVMPDKFFTQSNLEWCLAVLSALRRFSSDIPPGFAQEAGKTAYGLADYRGLLEPLGKKFFDRKTRAAVGRFLDAARPIYDSANRTVITHHEFYGSQILSAGKSLKLADWENVGWGHPLRDFTSLWVRAFEQPAWQRRFLEEFRKDLKIDPAEFEILFGVEKILQNFGNLILFEQTKLPEEAARRRPAKAFFRRCIAEALA